MKLHWGYRVAFLYCSFVVFMGFLVFKSSSEDFGLVSKDYYEKEIRYQQQIDKKRNNAALEEKVQIEWLGNEKKVRVLFPHHFTELNGEILLYRPSDASKDVKTPIQVNQQNMQEISVNALSKGLWRVQIEWKSANKEYFDEQPIVVQ